MTGSLGPNIGIGVSGTAVGGGDNNGHGEVEGRVRRELHRRLSGIQGSALVS